MEEIKHGRVLEFFAAANCYKGFVSYFDKLFPSEEYDKIYLLKGGPGTGKSSFMKAIYKAFINEKHTIELIYCSSDPRSLDGVIIASANKRVAILDSTSPHERDANIPGAIDEIINLADHFDKGWLVANRGTIISKGKEKAKAYKTAYNYLSIAGCANNFIKETHLAFFNRLKAKSKAECILQDIPRSEGGRISTRLVSSFGRFGDYRLNTLSTLPGRHIKICGDPDMSSVFLDLCFDTLKEREVNILHLPSALDPDSTDCIQLPDFSLTLSREIDGDVNAEDYFEISKIDLDKIKKAKQMREDALNEAKRWFGIASDIHFSLEEIYGQAMNFYKNESLIQEKIREIGIILENER